VNPLKTKHEPNEVGRVWRGGATKRASIRHQADMRLSEVCDDDMPKLFNVKIFTPEREFFDGDVEAISANAPDGNVMILADHAPFIMPVSVGNINIKRDGNWETSVNTEGFLEVHHKGVIVFVQACERPDEIDTRRAEEARRRAEEHLRQKQSMSEYRQSKIALARAMARLQFSSRDTH